MQIPMKDDAAQTAGLLPVVIGLWSLTALLLGGFVALGQVPAYTGLTFFERSMELVVLSLPLSAIYAGLIQGQPSRPLKVLGVLLLLGYAAFAVLAIMLLYQPNDLYDTISGLGEAAVYMLQMFSAELGIETGKLFVFWLRKRNASTNDL